MLARLDGQSADPIESETLECKRWDPRGSRKDQIRKLCEVAVCFANARGGMILVGIEHGRTSRSTSIHGACDLQGREPSGTRLRPWRRRTLAIRGGYEDEGYERGI